MYYKKKTKPDLINLLNERDNEIEKLKEELEYWKETANGKSLLDKIQAGKNDVTRDDVQNSLEEILIGGSNSERMKAIDLLNKMEGWYEKEREEGIHWKVLNFDGICQSCIHEWEGIGNGWGKSVEKKVEPKSILEGIKNG